MRAWRWFAVLAGLAVLDLALTIHAHLTFHRTPGGPTVMPLGQLLGWASSVVLIVAAACVFVGGHNEARRRERYHR